VSSYIGKLHSKFGDTAIYWSKLKGQ
jgi:hypothetical protein